MNQIEVKSTQHGLPKYIDDMITWLQRSKDDGATQLAIEFIGNKLDRKFLLKAYRTYTDAELKEAEISELEKKLDLAKKELDNIKAKNA